MTDMKLYHYSKELYYDLRTLKARGIEIDKAGMNKRKYKLGDYNEHISFFLEPVPLDILGTIFKGTGHDVWVPGNELYEYEVSVSHMPEFKYDIVESPLTNDLFYNPKYDDIVDEEWIDLLYQKKKEAGEIGYSKREFLKVAPQFVGILREEYKKLPKRPNWDKIKLKYAATCVHVMLYPEVGIIKYDKQKKVKVGNKRVSLESLPLFTTW